MSFFPQMESREHYPHSLFYFTLQRVIIFYLFILSLLLQLEYKHDDHNFNLFGLLVYPWHPG